VKCATKEIQKDAIFDSMDGVDLLEDPQSQDSLVLSDDDVEEVKEMFIESDDVILIESDKENIEISNNKKKLSSTKSRQKPKRYRAYEDNDPDFEVEHLHLYVFGFHFWFWWFRLSQEGWLHLQKGRNPSI